jgi:hypothetical protein
MEARALQLTPETPWSCTSRPLGAPRFELLKSNNSVEKPLLAGPARQSCGARLQPPWGPGLAA